MTKRRADISVSLADRGRPESWANEQEAAALSGMAPERFREQLPALESIGFPKPCGWNAKRFVPAILAFWEREHERKPLKVPDADVQDDGRSLENWS